jgi:hypothetical protein
VIRKIERVWTTTTMTTTRRQALYHQINNNNSNSSKKICMVIDRCVMIGLKRGRERERERNHRIHITEEALANFAVAVAVAQ